MIFQKIEFLLIYNIPPFFNSFSCIRIQIVTLRSRIYPAILTFSALIYIPGLSYHPPFDHLPICIKIIIFSFYFVPALIHTKSNRIKIIIIYTIMNPATGQPSSFSSIIGPLNQSIFLKNTFPVKIILIFSNLLFPRQSRPIFAKIIQFSLNRSPAT